LLAAVPDVANNGANWSAGYLTDYNIGNILKSGGKSTVSTSQVPSEEKQQ